MSCHQWAILGWFLFVVAVWMLAASARLYKETKDQLNEAEAEIEESRNLNKP